MNNFTYYLFLTLVISFITTFLLTKVLIPFFNKKNHHQPILEDVKMHSAKKNTPTMGGVAIISGVFLGTIFCLGLFFFFGAFSLADKLSYLKTTSVILIVFLIYGFLGFLDDYLKVFKKKNEGLNKPVKLLVLFFGSILFLIVSSLILKTNTNITIPFTEINFDLGIFYYPFVIFCFMAVTNAVNFTDGMDGLLSSVTIYFSLFFIIATTIIRTVVFDAYPVSAIYVSLVGSLFAFLFFNKYPAKIFMGDTGSLSISGLIISSLLLINFEFYLPIIGIIYVIEVLTVGIQIFYFKVTKGKRFFKMAPYHHHLELKGIKESKIVMIFSGITAVISIICIIIFYKLNI